MLCVTGRSPARSNNQRMGHCGYKKMDMVRNNAQVLITSPPST